MCPRGNQTGAVGGQAAQTRFQVGASAPVTRRRCDGDEVTRVPMDNTVVASALFEAQLGIKVKRAAYNNPQVAVNLFHRIPCRDV